LRKVAGLLLAAGAASRMGTPKQLLPLGESSLLQHVIEQALGSGIDALFLVLGHRAEDILARIAPDTGNPRLRIIHNLRYAEGISTSILSGILSIEKEYDHTVILLGDMPWITSGLIDLLIREYLQSGLSLGAVRTKKGRALPVIVGRKFYPHLHRLQGDVGARELFTRFPREVCFVEPDWEYEDADIDTPEDYKTLQRIWEGLREEGRDAEKTRS
jgi:molybdenum cofactor cytidylyltransferase